MLKTVLGGVGLAIDRGSVALRPDELEVDIWRFRAALALVRGHDHGLDGSCRACLAVLDGAVALDRGEFMAGFALRSSEACGVEHDPLRTRAQRPASSAVPTVAWATTLASTAGPGARSA